MLLFLSVPFCFFRSFVLAIPFISFSRLLYSPGSFDHIFRHDPSLLAVQSRLKRASKRQLHEYSFKQKHLIDWTNEGETGRSILRERRDDGQRMRPR
jgi:hypothetical protein